MVSSRAPKRERFTETGSESEERARARVASCWRGASPRFHNSRNAQSSDNWLPAKVTGRCSCMHSADHWSYKRCQEQLRALLARRFYR
eukprot:260109-Pyramimonas_sp.AAC.4